jgi:PTS system mannose-specific IIA component
LLDATEMITGKAEKIACIGLQPMDDVVQFVDRIQDAVDQVNDGDSVLLMVDLFGANPFNTGGRLFLEKKDHLELVTGMDLPMLVELLVAREGLNLDDASQMVLQAGVSGISRLSDKTGK